MLLSYFAINLLELKSKLAFHIEKGKIKVGRSDILTKSLRNYVKTSLLYEKRQNQSWEKHLSLQMKSKLTLPTIRYKIKVSRTTLLIKFLRNIKKWSRGYLFKPKKTGYR